MKEKLQNGQGHKPQESWIKPGTLPGGTREVAVAKTQVTFKAEGGTSLLGVLVHVTRQTAVFELYSPNIVPRLSQLMEEFKINLHGHEVYIGSAVIRNLVEAGPRLICEARLNEIDWTGWQLDQIAQPEEQLARQFKLFLNGWQKTYKISKEFKVAVADLQAFLHDLQLWVGQLEQGVQSQPKSKQHEFERYVLQELLQLAAPNLAALFEKFEKVIRETEKDLESSHSYYAKRALHPLVLSAPFMRRTFEKPLGYAGDYEMVNMMAQDLFKGDSLFAKMLNAFFLNTPPVVAHRNRIDSLVHRLQVETSRAGKKDRIKVFNLGCGPAIEIQRFLPISALSRNLEFTLLDFNNETVDYTKGVIQQINQAHHCGSQVQVLKKSVAQLLKDHSQFLPGSYDFVYCAGLFDYLPDSVCARLLEVFYALLAPGGLVLVTNVHVNNPSRGWMEYMVDWNLIYRDADQMSALLPGGAPREETRISVEPIGVNIFAEIRKPENG